MLLNEMEIFYTVVEQQSFSKAAKSLGVSKSFVSKKMTKLERTLKVRLISRSTRKLTLTEAGKSFYHHCANVVREGGRGYAMIDELKGKPAGLLKISIPPAIGLNLISPVIKKFLAQYPDVILDIKLESRLVDLIKEGYDLVLRSAKLESSNLIAQKVFNVTSVICATSKYLKNHGELTIPSDLTNHNCAVYSESNSAAMLKLENQESIYLKGNFMSNQLDLIKQLVLQDACIAVLPEFMVSTELKNKKLVRCLTAYRISTSDLYAIYPEKEFMLPKLNNFLKMVKEYLAKIQINLNSSLGVLDEK